MEKLRVPKNVRIDKLVDRFPVNGIKGFHKDKVYAILHVIRSQMRFLNRNGCYPGEWKKHYVPLSSAHLKNMVGNNYKEVLQWMQKAGLIYIDASYQKGVKCKHYRLADHYLGSGGRWVTVTCRSIKTKEPKVKWHIAPKAIKHLLKWLSPAYLTIDSEKAKGVLEYERHKSLIGYRGDDIQHRQMTANIKYSLGMDVVNDLNKLSKPVIQDNFGYRIHTPITRIKKSLRGHIHCMEKPLVQIDMKNSQLYFSLWLLNSANWKTTNKNHRELKAIFHDTSYTIGNNKNSNTVNTIIFINSLEKLYGKGFSGHAYCKDVCDGSIYEKIIAALDANNYFNSNWSFNKKRKKVKGILLKQLFGNPEDREHQLTVYSDAALPVWECFATLYPEIAELFQLIKSSNYKALCMLLQRIETTAMIGKVCGYMQRELPNIPIYTIHDCLVTTLDHVEQVKEAMKKVIAEFIGFPPSVSVEKWSDFGLNLPKKLQAKFAA